VSSSRPHFHQPRRLGRPVLRSDLPSTPADHSVPSEQQTAPAESDGKGERHARLSKQYEATSAQVVRERLAASSVGQVQPGITWILGEPGAGKSQELLTWGAALAHSHLLDRNQPLPVVLRCRSASALVAGEQGPHQSASAALFWKTWRNSADPLPSAIATRTLPALFASVPTRLIYLLDGLDELPEHCLEGFLAQLAELSRYTRLVISCRTAVWNNRLRAACTQAHLPIEAPPYELMGLEQNEQLQFLRQMPAVLAKGEGWISDLHQKLQASPQLRRLAANPLLLRLVGEVMATDNLQFPQSRSAFYAAAIRHTIARKQVQIGSEAASADTAAIDNTITHLHDLEQHLAKLGVADTLTIALLDKLRQEQPALARLKTSVIEESSGRRQLLRDYGERFLQQLAGQLLPNTQQKNIGLSVEFGLDQIKEAAKTLGCSEQDGLKLRDMLLDDHGSGLLTQEGHEKYSFVHPTFQEYFLAKFLFAHNADKVPEYLRVKQIVETYWVSAYFDEVLSLLLGMCGSEGRRAFDDVLLRFAEPPLSEEDRDYLLGVGRSPLRLMLYLLFSAGVEPNDHLNRVMQISSALRKCAIGRYKGTPASLLEKWVNGADKLFRRAVAGNLNAPVILLEILANDAYGQVRAAVAGNLNAPVDLLAKLVIDNDERVRAAVAGNLNAPVILLEKLAHDAYGQVRAAVAGNPNTSVALLAQLANDSDRQVRWAVMSNPNTPASLLIGLENSSERQVRWAIAENLNTPTEIMQLLANDGDYVVRRSVAENPNTPTEIMQLLANDGDYVVRRSVAENPNTSPETLQILAGDRNEYVRWGAARDTAPPEVPEESHDPEDQGIKWAVANNPNLILELV
jgi:hypothetical protein